MTARIADSLSKLKTADLEYGQLASVGQLNHEEDDDDSDDEDIQAFASLKQHEMSLLKRASGAIGSGVASVNGASQNGKNKEVWLEYGCI